MGEWKEYKLGEIAEIVGGGTPSTSVSEYWNGKIPWLTPRDLTGYNKTYISRGDRCITEKGLYNSSARLMPKGAVLLTSRAPIGYVAIAENEICTNQGFKSIIVDHKKAFNLFIYYWLKDNVDYLQSVGTGTTFAEISGSVVKDLDILLPPLPEQKAIADVLSSLDDKIDLLHRQNKTLEGLAEALWRKMFVEDANPDWGTVKVSDIIEVRDGTHDSPKQTVFGYNLITSKHLKDEGIDYANAYKISEDDYNQINKRSKVNTHDLLFSMIGTLGLLHYVEELPDFAIKNIGLFKSSQKPEFAKFLYLLLKSPVGSEFVIENTEGSTQEYISLGNLRGFTFQYPGDQIIKEFDNIISPYFEHIFVNKKQIRLLVKMRDSLLSKLMSGEVRVKL